MSDPDIPDDWQADTHRYIDGEWVMTYRTADGTLVDASGDGVSGDLLHESTTYLRTVEVGDVRYHERADGSGSSTWHGEDGQPATPDLHGADVVTVPSTTYLTEDGPFVIDVNGEDGTTVVLGPDGQPAPGDVTALAAEAHVPTVIAGAIVDGRQAFVALDADGDRHLVARNGEPIEAVIDWNDVEVVPLGVPTGRGVPIGDYATADGSVTTVLLFPDGSQAIETDDGLQRVAVPNDLDYPTGRSFFEGTFATESGALVDVFSYPNGQMAVRVDGELVLADLPLESTHPGDAPVSCGPYPGGELFVFPDGTQLLRDGDQWAYGDLPDIPTYAELTAPIPEPDDATYDDITELPDAPRPSPAPSPISDAIDTPLEPDDAGDTDAALPSLPDPTIGDPLDGLGQGLGGGGLDAFDDPPDDADDALTD